MALDELAQRLIIDAGVAPAAALGVAVRTARGWVSRTGESGIRSRLRPTAVTAWTPFDLASLTKPMVAAAVARLVSRGRLDWETPLGVLLPELTRTRSASTPLRLFLSHRAGLHAHQSLFLRAAPDGRLDPAQAFVAAANARRHDCAGAPPDGGFEPVYSDLGYLLVGAVVARVEGEALERVVAREVTEPLGIDVASARTWLCREPEFRERVAPTEVVDGRGGEIVGDVHDENAWAISGLGLCGHAGLFGSVHGVLGFGTAMLDAVAGRSPAWLRAETARVLIEPRAGGTLRAGFDGRSEEGSSAGAAFSARSFGHLGFTGTSVWCDPDTDIVAVVLTNRVNPTRDNVKIREVRPVIHSAMHEFARVLASEGSPGAPK